MATGHLNKTFSGAGNTKTATQSFWIKRANISANMMAGITVTGGGSYYGIQFLTDDVLDIYLYNSGSAWEGRLKTNRKFRDTNAWYHFVLAWDTTQSTSSDRLKFYVNGVQETSFQIATYPNQNQDLLFNTATAHQINAAGGGNWDGQMAHFNYVDGTALTPTSFGETDATTGIWKPKTAPSVTYGTNGFFLKFENAANMGLDSSGQSNNWTTSGTIIKNIDTPSNVFATWNPLDNSYAGATFGSCNTGLDSGGSGIETWNTSTLGASSGKYYFELKHNGGSGTPYRQLVGITQSPTTSASAQLGSTSTSWGYYDNTGNVRNNNSNISWSGNTWTQNDIIGVAMDLDNNRLFFSKNGTWQNSADPTTSTGAITITDGTYFFAWGDATANSNYCNANFGNGYFGTTAVSSAQNPDDGIGIFEYDVPAGYRALCTKSINAEEYS